MRDVCSLAIVQSSVHVEFLESLVMQTDTRDVWPWSLLVPLLEKEIWQRLPLVTGVWLERWSSYRLISLSLHSNFLSCRLANEIVVRMRFLCCTGCSGFQHNN